MNQTQVLDEKIRNQHQEAYLRRQAVEIETGIYDVPVNWTPVVETAFPMFLRPEDTDIMRARLILDFIWTRISYIRVLPVDAYEWRRTRWEWHFRDDFSLMRLIRESETNTNLFLSPRPRRNNELRRLLNDVAQSDVAAVSSNILRLIEAEESNISPAHQHQFQPLFRRLRAVVLRLRRTVF